MKTRRTILFFLFIIHITAQSQIQNQVQQYFSNNIWTEYWINTQGDPSISFKNQYYTANDTIIGEKTYRKIIDKDLLYIGAIREEDGKVYARLNYYGPEYDEFLLYDFTVQVGDVITSSAFEGTLSHPDGIIVTNIDEIELETGEKRKRFFFDQTSEWIEGIGSVNGLFHDIVSHLTDYTVSYLVCFQQNNIPLYVNEEKCLDGMCCEKLLGTDLYTSLYDDKKTVFPNPIKRTVKILFPKTEKYITIKILNTQGRTINILSFIDKQQIEIDFSRYISGVYYIIADFCKSSEIYKVIKQ